MTYQYSKDYTKVKQEVINMTNNMQYYSLRIREAAILEIKGCTPEENKEIDSTSKLICDLCNIIMLNLKN